MYGPKPNTFKGFGDIYGPKAYKFMGFSDITPAIRGIYARPEPRPMQEGEGAAASGRQTEPNNQLLDVTFV